MVAHRRVIFIASLIATAASFFTLGVLASRREHDANRAGYDAQLAAFRAEVRREINKDRPRPGAVATHGLAALETEGVTETAAGSTRAKIVAQVKQELQDEMGLLPLHLLRDRRSSFVELYATDSLGKTNYGTAGYLGGGYFITVKHAVVALNSDDERQAGRKMASIRVIVDGAEVPAKVVDAGDADVEVHNGDWAIIKTKDVVDLPPLNVDTSFGYNFADPIFRLGNDYSKGIVVSTGYVGQKTANGLVTCLTDGHPGVSGGGVLNQKGDLVGIPVGRMQGDYRFSFILPLRGEMLRKVPAVAPPAPQAQPNGNVLVAEAAH